MRLNTIANIIKINIRARINNQYLGLSNFIKIKTYKIFIIINLFKILFSTAILIGLYKHIFIVEKKYPVTFLLIIFIIINTVYNGVKCFKRTHWPINIQLLKLTPLKECNIYLLLFLEEYIWFHINNITTSIFYFIILIVINNKVNFTIIVLSLHLFCSLLFLISNRFWGIYQIELIKKSIRTFRFFVYFIKSCILFFAGYKIVDIIYNPIISFKKYINLIIKNPIYINDNEKAKFFIDNIKQQFIEPIKYIIIDIKKFNLIIKNLNLNIVILMDVIITIIFIIIIYKFSPIYIDKSEYEFNKLDIINFYKNLLIKLKKIAYRNSIWIEKDIIVLIRTRWVISQKFFSIAFVNSDFCFNLGIIFSLTKFIKSPGVFLTILLIFNLMSIFNQTKALLKKWPHVFSINAERLNINLIKLSSTSINLIYKNKLNLIRSCLVIPSFLCFIFDIVIILKFSINDYLNIVFILLINLLSIWISPITNFYMEPLFANFKNKTIDELLDDRLENNIKKKFQLIPKKIMLTPFLLILYINIFVYLPVYITNILPYMFMIYVFLVFIIMNKFLSKFQIKGVEKIDNENIFL